MWSWAKPSRQKFHLLMASSHLGKPTLLQEEPRVALVVGAGVGIEPARLIKWLARLVKQTSPQTIFVLAF